MRTSRMMLATAIVGLGFALLAVPVAVGTAAEDDDAVLLARLADELTAAESEVQAEIDHLDRCVDDPDCIVVTGGDEIPDGTVDVNTAERLFPLTVAAPLDAHGAARGFVQRLMRVPGVHMTYLLARQLDSPYRAGPAMSSEVFARLIREHTQSASQKRDLLRTRRADLAAELVAIGELRDLVAEGLPPLTGQERSDASLAGPTPATTLMVDVDGAGLAALPEGDDVHYTIHCKGTSRETGLDATAPSRNAHNLEELEKQISYHPNSCVSDENYERQLTIDVYTRTVTGEWEITETRIGTSDDED